MNDPKYENILFLGLSSSATGEIYSLISAFRKFNNAKMKVDILVHKTQENIFSDLLLTVDYHTFNKLSLKALLSELSTRFKQYDYVVIFDLNAFILEHNPESGFVLDVLDFLNTGGEKGNIAVIDYFCSFEQDENEFKKQVEFIKQTLHERIDPLKRMPMRSAKMYYFIKFLPSRVMRQFNFISQSIKLLRPVPYCFPRVSPNSNISYYSNRFWEVPVQQKNKTKILFGFSKYFIRSLNAGVLEKLTSYLIRQVRETMDVTEVIIIDPIGFSGKIKADNRIQVTPVEWLSRNDLNQVLGETCFVGLFVFYSILGTVALLNKIPYMAFYSSKSSHQVDYLSEIFDPINIPRTNAIGLWEEIAYFNRLSGKNPFFDTVIPVDIAEKDSFNEAIEAILTGKAHLKIENYLKVLNGLKLPAFNELFY